MGVKMRGQYIGNKKIQITHLDSGYSIVTSAPKDNQGDGSSFSPTDLLTCSLGSCMLTIIAIVAESGQINLEGSFFEVEKIMSQGTPRKISNINLFIHLPSQVSFDDKAKLERAAKTCPVHYSLSQDIDIQVEFLYDLAS